MVGFGVAHCSDFVQVCASAKGGFRASEKGDFLGGVVFECDDGVVEFEARGGVDGVAAVGTVDGDGCDAAGCGGDEDRVWLIVHFGWRVEYGSSFVFDVYRALLDLLFLVYHRQRH